MTLLKIDLQIHNLQNGNFTLFELVMDMVVLFFEYSEITILFFILRLLFLQCMYSIHCTPSKQDILFVDKLSR